MPAPETDIAELPESWVSFSPRQRAILEVIPHHYTLSAAADACGISRVTVWRWAQEDELFRNAVQLAKEQVGDLIEGETIRRGMEGKSSMSDTLLIFATKRFRPEYREQYTVNTKVDVRVSVEALSPQEQLDVLELALLSRKQRLLDAGSIEGTATELPPT